MKQVKSIAVLRSNFDYLAPLIADQIKKAPLTGLDIETAQPRAHAGIKAYNTGKRLAMDIKRTDLCGLSLHADNADHAFYFNIGHADAHERIEWSKINNLLNEKPSAAKWVVHNATFERTMMEATVGYVLRDYVCSMQMCVSAYGPDEYDREVFQDRDLGDIAILIPEIIRTCRDQTLTNAVQKLMSKVIAKESDAAHSYNGYVNQMRYGYGLKSAVQAFFSYQMKTYAECLGDKAHMGELTTEETVSYGCDDAIWCLRLFHRVLRFMMETNPAVVSTFFSQELPMVELYSEVWREGVVINHEAVIAQQQQNREDFASKTKKLKKTVLNLFPFESAPHPELFEREPWYAKNWQRYRNSIIAWATSDDVDDPFLQACQLGGAIPKAWAEERGRVFPKALNLTHYMPARVLMYDLFNRPKLILEKGKVQSDGEARGRLREQLLEEGQKEQAAVLDILNELGTIEQAEKLYLVPYLKLVDPNTGKLHPTMNSLLATRRMAMSQPNATQLAKRGATVYVRGFYKADHPDHVIVSLDWEQIELVLFGEFSGDPVLASCYSKIPYDDVHTIATAACLEVSEEEIMRLKRGDPNVSPHLLINPKGEPLALDKAFKFWRTEVGKGSNFEFIYSGLLSNLGNKLGWERDKMYEVTDAYASKFAMASEWRQEIINEVRDLGYTTLPDAHTRVRFEATPEWAHQFRAKWRRYNSPEVSWFGDQVIRRIQTRAGNQAINAKIQGTSATLTKRSSIGIRNKIIQQNMNARVMFCVHDEIVASVHRDQVVPYINMAREIMMNHADVIKNLKISATPSVGLTYQPWDPVKAPTGQIELFEAPALPWVPPELVGKRLPDTLWGAAVDHLFAVA